MSNDPKYTFRLVEVPGEDHVYVIDPAHWHGRGTYVDASENEIDDSPAIERKTKIQIADELRERCRDAALLVKADLDV